MIPWVKCPDCGDWFCRLHGKHAADCPCPGVEDWLEQGMWPYDECDAEKARALSREYLRFIVARSSHGLLEPVHPGALVYYSDAEKLSGPRRVILTTHVWDAYEDSRSESICGCQTEKVMEEDAFGTYWRCPECEP